MSISSSTVEFSNDNIELSTEMIAPPKVLIKIGNLLLYAFHQLRRKQKLCCLKNKLLMH